jgi:hypothetical protein
LKRRRQIGGDKRIVFCDKHTEAGHAALTFHLNFSGLSGHFAGGLARMAGPHRIAHIASNSAAT